MNTLRTITIVLVGVVLSGCETAQESAAQGKDIDALKRQVVELRNEMEKLATQLDSLKERQGASDYKDFVRGLEEVAYLRPGDTGYSAVRFDLGTLTIQMTDIRPYGNGSKILLRFGNPLASTLNGIGAKLVWGRTDEDGSPREEEKKTQIFTFTESLQSGAWTSIPVVLEGLPPEELGFVAVSDVTHSGIALTK